MRPSVRARHARGPQPPTQHLALLPPHPSSSRRAVRTRPQSIAPLPAGFIHGMEAKDAFFAKGCCECTPPLAGARVARAAPSLVPRRRGSRPAAMHAILLGRRSKPPNPWTGSGRFRSRLRKHCSSPQNTPAPAGRRARRPKQPPPCPQRPPPVAPQRRARAFHRRRHAGLLPKPLDQLFEPDPVRHPHRHSPAHLQVHRHQRGGARVPTRVGVRACVCARTCMCACAQARGGWGLTKRLAHSASAHAARARARTAPARAKPRGPHTRHPLRGRLGFSAAKHAAACPSLRLARQRCAVARLNHMPVPAPAPQTGARLRQLPARDDLAAQLRLRRPRVPEKGPWGLLFRQGGVAARRPPAGLPVRQVRQAHVVGYSRVQGLGLGRGLWFPHYEHEPMIGTRRPSIPHHPAPPLTRSRPVPRRRAGKTAPATRPAAPAQVSGASARARRRGEARAPRARRERSAPAGPRATGTRHQTPRRAARRPAPPHPAARSHGKEHPRRPRGPDEQGDGEGRVRQPRRPRHRLRLHQPRRVGALPHGDAVRGQRVHVLPRRREGRVPRVLLARQRGHQAGQLQPRGNNVFHTPARGAAGRAPTCPCRRMRRTQARARPPAANCAIRQQS